MNHPFYDAQGKFKIRENFFGDVQTQLNSFIPQTGPQTQIPSAKIPYVPPKPKLKRKMPKKIEANVDKYPAIPDRRKVSDKTQTIRVNIKKYRTSYVIRDCQGSTFSKDHWVCIVIGLKFEGIQNVKTDISQIESTMARASVNEDNLWTVNINRNLIKTEGYVDILAIPSKMFSEIEL